MSQHPTLTVLVCAATGTVGRRLVPLLEQRGATVSTYDRTADPEPQLVGGLHDVGRVHELLAAVARDRRVRDGPGVDGDGRAGGRGAHRRLAAGGRRDREDQSRDQGQSGGGSEHPTSG